MIAQAKVQGAVVTLSATPSPTGEVAVGIGYISTDARLLQQQTFAIPAETAEEWARGILDAAAAAREAAAVKGRA